MNKICTDINQSKKLMELGIDVNTADMYYEKICNLPKAIVGNYILHNQCMEDKDYKKLSNPVLSPSWSLSALLDVLPKEINVLETIYSINIHTKNEKWFIDYKCNNEEFDGVYSNIFVDACYEMIVKLHELNIL